jgi:NAD+ diphosphatase
MSDYFYKNYKYCPICGNKYSDKDFDEEAKVLICQNCKYRYFQNIIAVTSAIIPLHNNPYQVLFATRNIEPMKGKIDMPGGFPKFDEHPKETIKREMKEELGLNIKIKQLCSIGINDYEYNGMIFKHCVLYFLTEPVGEEDIKISDDENSSFKFLDIRNLENFKSQIGFRSDIQAIADYLSFLDNS